jgi:hypothetical protein
MPSGREAFTRKLSQESLQACKKKKNFVKYDGWYLVRRAPKCGNSTR